MVASSRPSAASGQPRRKELVLFYLTQTIGIALQIYAYMIIGRAILSWFPLRSGTTMYSIYSFLYELTEPYLALFRRFLPTPRFGSVGIDISAIVGLLVLFAAGRILGGL